MAKQKRTIWLPEDSLFRQRLTWKKVSPLAPSLWTPGSRMMGRRRCCCSRTRPCCCGDSPAQWIIDLGIGGWTDNRCDQCNEVVGEFVVVENHTITGHELTCLFAYSVDHWCDDSIIGDCDIGDHDGFISFIITLRIPLNNIFVPTCTITCRVELAQDLGQDGFCTALCYANYTGTFTKASYDGCLDPDFVPFALTRESDACTANNNLGLLCNGRLPATIYLRAA